MEITLAGETVTLTAPELHGTIYRVLGPMSSTATIWAGVCACIGVCWPTRQPRGAHHLKLDVWWHPAPWGTLAAAQHDPVVFGDRVMQHLVEHGATLDDIWRVGEPVADWLRSKLPRADVAEEVAVFSSAPTEPTTGA